MPRNASYAQSEGVTAFIDVSAAAVIETARQYPEKIGKVGAGRNGIIGALTEDLIDTTLDQTADVEKKIPRDFRVKATSILCRARADL